jgi:hypothetical protein
MGFVFPTYVYIMEMLKTSTNATQVKYLCFWNVPNMCS